MKLYLNIIYIILYICIISTPVLSVDISRLYEFYDPDREVGICGKTSVWLNNDMLEFKLKGYSFYTYGTRYYVKIKCSSTYKTIIHSHPPESPCEFSELDLKTFSKRKIRTSLLLCNNSYRIITKTHGSVYERLFNYSKPISS